ncbi:hypothetical protein [Pseudomonas viridiflava]|uniref:hypothetical protein n=1 Tax=Pseudomonas viridiflava TaxID=33069 RepID=UPI0018E661C5|nr:hypothetical protein [Pseudomonas viridiflava]MBI6706507.1 hypothetical protein [Pseudomonas viridiflava]MBI6725737.1 hypothetical protein [Pseudomonas viridiflava]
MHKADELGFVALDLNEQALIQHLRRTSLEGREEVYAATARLRHLKPRVLEKLNERCGTGKSHHRHVIYCSHR